MRKDLRYAVRTLRQTPVLTGVAVLSLALGIGANTAIFSLFHQALLRLLPVRDPQRLVVLHVDEHFNGWATADNRESVWSYPMYRDFVERSPVFDGIAGRASAPVSIADGQGTERARAEIVTGAFFPVLGVQALFGRTILPEDDGAPGAHPVCVLSYGYWQTRFGGRRDVLNRKIAMNGHPMQIIGVLPPGYHGVVAGNSADVYVPAAMKRETTPTWYGLDDYEVMWLSLFARLKPGVSIRQAEAAMQPVWRTILEDARTRAGRMRSRRAEQELMAMKLTLRPAGQGINHFVSTWQKPLTVLMAIVGLVLLIACANVANLLVTRAAGRQKEMAVRLAIGASRGALARQLLIEGLVLAVAGGALGIVIARATVASLLKLLPEGATGGWITAQLDSTMLLFAAGLAAVTGLLFGLAPAIQASRAEVAAALKNQAASVLSGAGQTSFRRALVVAQVALSLVLLAGAGLFATSLRHLMRVDPGFRTEGVLMFAVDPASNGYSKERGDAFFRELSEHIRRLPGVEAVGAANPAPFTGSNRGGSITVEGYTPRDDETVGASQHEIAPGFFEALSIPILAGRSFEERDVNGGPKTVVVNQAFVDRYLARINPLGRHIAFSGGRVTPDYEIVGVAANIKHEGLRENAQPTIYFPYSRAERLDALWFFVAAKRGAAELGPDIRRIVRELDPNLPVWAMEPLARQVAESAYSDRLLAVLSTAFAALATLLAAIGLYGVIAYTVARRTSEIGVRMTIGAAPGAVLWLVLRDVVMLASIGLASGLGAALACARLVQSQLYGLKAADPAVLGGAVVVLGAVALAAGYIPARRAAAIDPIRACCCNKKMSP
jgi:predicted permease